MIIVKQVPARFVRCDSCGAESSRGCEYAKDAYIAAADEDWLLEDGRDLCSKCTAARVDQSNADEDNDADEDDGVLL